MFTFSDDTPTESEIKELINLHTKELPYTRFSVLPTDTQLDLYLFMSRKSEKFQFIICRHRGKIVGAVIIQKSGKCGSGLVFLLSRNWRSSFIPLVKNFKLFIIDTIESVLSGNLISSYDQIVSVYIDSQYRQKGIGSELLNVAPLKLAALTRIDNLPAHSLYLKNGFYIKRQIGKSLLFLRDLS